MPLSCESLAKIGCNARLSDECVEDLRAALTIFFKKIQRLWARCGRRRSRLLTKHGKHFEGDIVVTERENAGDGGENEDSGRLSRSSGGGRPVAPYADLSKRSQRRSSRELSREHQTEELIQAAAQRARAEGRSDVPYVLKETMTSPTRP